METGAVIVFCGVFFLTGVILKLQRKRMSNASRNYPPSLSSVPVLGSFPFLPPMDQLHLFYTKKAEELGPIFMVTFAEVQNVVLSGKDIIQEAFVKLSAHFSHRPQFFLDAYSNSQHKGIVEHFYDADFKKYHSLSLNILKKFGFGQGIMERRIQVEVDDLLNHLKKMNGEPVCPVDLIMGSVANVITSIILGNRYERSDPELQKAFTNAHDVIASSIQTAPINFFPVLRFLPWFWKRAEKSLQLHDEIIESLDKKIDATLSGEIGESFISHFIDEEGSDFDRTQLVFLLRDLQLAGTETVSTTLLWGIVALANYRDIQDRLRKEIDSAVPAGNRLPSLDDKPKLPFLQAAILELMRWKTILPLNLLHSTPSDTTLRGFFIPKGSLVTANLYSVHMDPNVFPEPEIFRPERFLDEDCRIINQDTIMPFSIGKRACLGELLARQEIFLFLAGLLQNFVILPPEGKDLIECHEVTTLTTGPSRYQVRFVPRSLQK